MTKDLFREFEEVSAKQWKQKIQFDLKGADYNEALVWKSPDGVDVKPFYHPDESPQPVHVSTPPNWNIAEQIYVASAEGANRRARKVLEKGAESLWFLIPSEEVNLKILFSELDLRTVPIYLKLNFISAEFLRKLNEYIPAEAEVYLQTDIVGNLARTGNFYENFESDFEFLESAVESSSVFKSVLSVDAQLYQNAGANIPQELAYALAHAHEYLNQLEKKDFFSSQKEDFQIQFLVSCGPNYFFEIAKLRALRLLWSSLAQEYEVSEKCHILAQPSRRNKTLYDFNVNLLRTTTECMSAVLGGADAVCNMAYDAVFHKNNDFGSRIARNQLLILKHESYFEKVANPAEGSYYVETLTQQFAEKALEIFKTIEKGGGFLQQLKDEIIQKKISESAEIEQEKFDSGDIVLIGSNKYPNPEDRMKEELELYPFLKQNPRKTLVRPILEKRLSEKEEQERLIFEE